MTVVKSEVLGLDGYLERLNIENGDRLKKLLSNGLKDFMDKNPNQYHTLARMSDELKVLEREWNVVQVIINDLKQVRDGQKDRLDKAFNTEVKNYKHIL